MYCVCEEGYVGDAEKQCLPGLLECNIDIRFRSLRPSLLMLTAYISSFLPIITLQNPFPDHP